MRRLRVRNLRRISRQGRERALLLTLFPASAFQLQRASPCNAILWRYNSQTVLNVIYDVVINDVVINDVSGRRSAPRRKSKSKERGA